MSHKSSMMAMFEAIRHAFPRLRSTLSIDHPELDLVLDFPVQAGLRFKVSANLQDDEIHLSAGALRVSFFPCSNPEIAQNFRTAFVGLLEGRFRVIEEHVGGHPITAQLQAPAGGSFETIYTWSKVRVPMPWQKHTTRVLQNA